MRVPLRIATCAAAVLASTAAVSLAAAAPALASCTDGTYDEPPPPITELVPADGTSFEQTIARPVDFVLLSPLHGGFFVVRIANSSFVGQTGLLSDLHEVDEIPLLESFTDFGYYAGRTGYTGSLGGTTWMDTPGTYYRQLWGSWTDDVGGCHAFAGPVETITVTASAPPSGPPVVSPPPGETPTPPGTPGGQMPPGGTPPTGRTAPSAPSPPGGTAPSSPGPPAIAFSELPRDAERMIRERTGKRPPVKRACSRDDATTIECVLKWRSRLSSYLANGTFSHVAKAGGRWTSAYDFKGLRAWWHCRPHRRCTVHNATLRHAEFSWHSR